MMGMGSWNDGNGVLECLEFCLGLLGILSWSVSLKGDAVFVLSLI